MKTLLLLVAAALSLSGVVGLDNGLALTPPMGWLSWERFTCNTDCDNDPANCISERLYKDMADRLVADGWRDLGYRYVNIDDCWMEMERDAQGRLVPHKKRFPSGIKALADYMHQRGLKLGIYQDVGTKTCAGYPGSVEHFEIDAKTFEEWEVDSLKVDGCYADPKEMDTLYPQYSQAISNLSRPILFSCEWPFYQHAAGMQPDYPSVARYCNTWRNFDDIADSWSSVLSIVDYYAKNQEQFVAVAGPGRFHDPDMVLGGNFGLSFDEARAQFMLWAVLASPLLMSNDLRDLRPEVKALLQNREILAVNQDPLGMMGKQVYKNGNSEIWTRPVTPVSSNGNYSYAIVFINRETLGGPSKVSIQLKTLGLNNTDCYSVYDVFSPNVTKKYCPQDTLKVRVDPSGATMVVAKNLKKRSRCLKSKFGCKRQ